MTVAIRPEALAIGPNVPADSNRFAATVERLVFLGEVRQVHLRGPGDWPVIALALQSQSQSLREGQSLTLSSRPSTSSSCPASTPCPGEGSRFPTGARGSRGDHAVGDDPFAASGFESAGSCRLLGPG